MKVLKKAIMTALAGTALGAGFSGPASAINVQDLGVLRKKVVLTNTTNLPKYAWDGTAGLGEPPNNEGWAHTSKWFTFKVVGRSHVTIRLKANGDLNPAFTIWKTGGAFDGVNHTSHVYNQIGIDGTSTFLATGPDDKDKVTQFIGYANSGPAFEGATGPIQQGGTYGAYVKQGYARLLAVDLLPGQYLLAIGGSCYSDGQAKTCGEGLVESTLKLTRQPAN